MDRHFLVAVSEQKSALNGIRFLTSFFSNNRSVKITLFYASPKSPAYWENESNLDSRAECKDLARKLRAEGKQVLRSAEKKSVELGVPRENLYQKIIESRLTTVEDIIHEGESGRYDAVILGRRSLGLLESAIGGSTSKSLLQSQFNFPLWICRSIKADRKNVLLVGDGTPISYSMANHVGLTISKEHRHRVDILLEERLWNDDAVKSRYNTIFAEHKIKGEQINWLPAPKGNQAHTIMKLVTTNGYAAVAVGRTNPEQNMINRLFKGPVCSALYRDLQDTCLWVCN